MQTGREIHGPRAVLFFLFFNFDYLSAFEMTAFWAHTVRLAKFAAITANHQVGSDECIM
jgi:hypothetical protein